MTHGNIVFVNFFCGGIESERYSFKLLVLFLRNKGKVGINYKII